MNQLDDPAIPLGLSAERDGLDEQEIQIRVGERIRDLRAAIGLRATELAERAGISQGQLSKIETGKATLSIKTLARLCAVLDRPLSYLFQSEREMPRSFGVLGTLNVVEGPESQGVRRFVDEVARATGGRLTFLPLRASQAGAGREQVLQLRDGLIDIFVEDLALYQEIAPALGFLSTPYAFDDDAHLQRFLLSPAFVELAVRPLRRTGIRLLNRRWNWRRGVETALAAKRPVLAPRDLEGLRIRVQELTGQAEHWRALGAEPVTLPWAEVKAALARGEIDGVATHKAHLYPLGFCRHAPYVTLLDDLAPVIAVGVNDIKFQALPPDAQEALAAACDRAGDAFSALVQNAEADNEPRNVAEFDAVYIRPPTAPWRRAAETTQRRLVEEGRLPEAAWREIRRLAGAAP